MNAITVATDQQMEPADQSQSTITSTASIASSSPATSLQSLSLASSADGKGDKFRITLDNPTNTYYSGQTIHGTISLNCKQKKKIRGKHINSHLSVSNELCVCVFVWLYFCEFRSVFYLCLVFCLFMVEESVSVFTLGNFVGKLFNDDCDDCDDCV